MKKTKNPNSTKKIEEEKKEEVNNIIKYSSGFIKWKERCGVLTLAFPAVNIKDFKGWETCCNELILLVNLSLTLVECTSNSTLVANEIFQMIQLCLMSGCMVR